MLFSKEKERTEATAEVDSVGKCIALSFSHIIFVKHAKTFEENKGCDNTRTQTEDLGFLCDKLQIEIKTIGWWSTDRQTDRQTEAEACCRSFLAFNTSQNKMCSVVRRPSTESGALIGC